MKDRIEVKILPTKKFLGITIRSKTVFELQGEQVAEIHVRSWSSESAAKNGTGAPSQTRVLEVILSSSSWPQGFPRQLLIEDTRLVFRNSESSYTVPYRTSITLPEELATSTLPVFGTFEGPFFERIAEKFEGGYWLFCSSGAGGGIYDTSGHQLCRVADAWRDSEVSRGVFATIEASISSTDEEASAFVLLTALIGVHTVPVLNSFEEVNRILQFS
jgi:hypothetical protein